VNVRAHDAVDLPQRTVLSDHLVAFSRGVDFRCAVHLE
jgi:hypothetical protein